MRPTDIIPKTIIDELLRLAKLDRNWARVTNVRNTQCDIAYYQDTWLRSMITAGSEALGLKATSIWLLDGPKIFRPSKEQCAALENINVNLTVQEYSQPYPSILIEVDYPPFHSVLCYQETDVLAFVLNSKDHLNDISTTIVNSSDLMEVALNTYDNDCESLQDPSIRALRVACNSCLALSHYGNHIDFLYPKEVQTDRRLAKENSERGERARRRLNLAVQIISFDQEVKIHKTETKPYDSENKESKGTVSTHWRRGHWAMQPHGPHNSLRKRILRPPVLVRSDLFVGELSNTQTTYKS
jgi:hypothetical protein